MKVVHYGQIYELDHDLIAQSLQRAEARAKKPKRMIRLDGGELDSQLTRCEKALRWEVYDWNGKPHRIVPASEAQFVRATSAYFQRRLAAFFTFEKYSRQAKAYVTTDCPPKLASMLARAGNFACITKLKRDYSADDGE